MRRSPLFAPLVCTAILAGTAALAASGPPDPSQLKPIRVAAPDAPSVPLLDADGRAEQWEHMLDQTMVRNVAQPTLYPVLPDAAKANGKAVIVVPGGGYAFVSMDSEGFRVAQRLAARGYAAFVLKYRVRPTPRDAEEYVAETMKAFGTLGKGELPDHKPAVDDLAAALRLVQRDAAKWRVDPAKIGVIGFSAGSRTLIRLLEKYPEAALVHHAGLLYPPMTQTVTGGPRPPLFLAIAVDDPLFKQGGLNLLDRWLAESDKVEFHLYSGGSHGFGMRPMGTTSDHWIDEYLGWLDLR